MKIINFFFLIALIVGCNNETSEIDHLFENEVRQLTTLEDKETFLTKIFEDDQKVRGGENEIIMTYGLDSEQHKAYFTRQLDQDAINQEKVELYLDLYGHPSSNDSLNYKAETAIWAVVQHSDVDFRKENFDHLYEAQLRGDFDLSWILDRMYQIKFRREYEHPSFLKPEVKTKQMIIELGLEELAKKVERNMMIRKKEQAS